MWRVQTLQSDNSPTWYDIIQVHYALVVTREIELSLHISVRLCMTNVYDH